MNRNEMTKDMCDIVIPVYNSLNYVTACIDSILKYTDYPYNIVIVDDGSDTYVRQKLNQYEEDYSHIRVLYNKENLGFIGSVNRGIRESKGEYILLLHSDTFVTPGWLGRMVRCAESDDGVGAVNPISNMAVHLSVQMPPGFNIFTMDEKISEISSRTYPDIVTTVGFCFVIKRNIINNFRGFDKIYGRGYREESDCCVRVVETGYRVVVADDVFVYHKGCTSFGTWLERYYKNRKIFDSHWGKLYGKVYKQFCEINPVGYLRDTMTKDLEVPKLGTEPIKSLWDMTLDTWERGGIKGLIYKLPIIPLRVVTTVKKITRQIRSQISAVKDPSAKQNFYVTDKYMSRLPKGKGIRVAFMIYQLDISGGIVSILQLVNELIIRGHTAYIVTLSEEPEPGTFDMYTRPIRFKNEKEMVECFPEVDIVIATYWPTAYYWMPKILSKNPNLISVYFIQDFESWFYPEGKSNIHRKIIESYNHVDFRIVKSQWLKNKLTESGYSAHRIHLGLDLEVFYPRDIKPKTDKKRILLQARPSETRRGFENALKVFKILSLKRKDIEFVFFGCRDIDLKPFNIPFRYINEGIIYDPNNVASLHSSCDLLFDPSLFQGFGRPGLEAMACGIPTVLTKEGGITEYAEDGVNTLLIDPKDINGMVEAIMKVLDDKALRSKFIQNGLKTAKKYSYKEEAKQHLEFYNKILMKK